MSNGYNDDIEQDENKVDWNELIGESPRFIDVTKFEMGMIIFLIVFVIFVIGASIWGLWQGGTQ